ncbi:MAG: ATP-dependent sacrificial sulfur transferase LarE [Lachnospiraceae bacterium]|nr:ATP-dependent sacrificial sulfur transferase LarE [Lachnospiraceae bacterium]
MDFTECVPKKLQQFFSKHPKAALAFSGGTDSAYLLWAGVQCGCDIKPYFIKTAFQPEFELMDAARLTEESDIPLTIVELDILSDKTIASNPSDRCYYCKTNLFTALKQRACTAGYTTIIDGTNASDDVDDRPGMKAIRELGVLSPLRLSGITKEQVRAFSKAAGLFTALKPSYACLATRIPSGASITAKDLTKIERSEESLRQLGYSDFRIRLFHGCARIQLKQSDFSQAISGYNEITATIGDDFEGVFLDLTPRSTD